MAKYTYPAIFYSEANGIFVVDFPDLNCTTHGNDITNAIEMAEDALSLYLYSLEEDGFEIPAPSPISSVHPDEEGSFVSYISVDTLEYRKRFRSKAVNKTVTLPEWMNELAMNSGVNFSNLLQQAIRKELHL